MLGKIQNRARYFRIILRKFLQDYTMRGYVNEPLIREVLKCQAEIASLDPHPHYLRAYRKAEIFYWLHIPEWMYEDWKEQKVERMLDIGCGYGTLALYCKKLFDCEIFCTDFVDTYLSKSLVRKYKFRFETNNIELDDFPWNTEFDIIILTEVLEHFNFHPLPTLKKIRSLLSKNGKLYLSTPDASQWGRIKQHYSRLDEMPIPKRGLPIVDAHVYHYDKNELIRLFDDALLKVCRFDYSPSGGARHFNVMLMRK